MEEWDDRALREINSLDAARLAIRGALATIRDLQDQNGVLKGQVQDDGAKRKAYMAKCMSNADSPRGKPVGAAKPRT